MLPTARRYLVEENQGSGDNSVAPEQSSGAEEAVLLEPSQSASTRRPKPGQKRASVDSVASSVASQPLSAQPEGGRNHDNPVAEDGTDDRRRSSAKVQPLDLNRVRGSKSALTHRAGNKKDKARKTKSHPAMSSAAKPWWRAGVEQIEKLTQSLMTSRNTSRSAGRTARTGGGRTTRSEVSTSRRASIAKVAKNKWIPKDLQSRSAGFYAPKGFLHPSGNIKSYWDFAVVFVVLFVAFEIPYVIAFVSDPPPGLVALDYIVDVFFWADILVNFRTGMLNRWGDLVYEQHCVARAYIKGWFLVDLISTLPLELLCISACPILRFPRLLRITRVLRKFKSLTSANVLRLLMLITGFVLCAHWVACAAYAVAYSSAEAGKDSWLSQEFPDADLASVGTHRKFVTSLYWALTTLTTVGYGDIRPHNDDERLYSVFVLIFGAVLYATVFANVTAIIGKLDASGSRYKERITAINEFFRLHELPEELKNRTVRYIDAKWSIEKGIDIDTVLQELPDFLQGDIKLSLHGHAVRNLPFFRNGGDGFLRALVTRLKPHVCLPGDYILKTGDLALEMYFLYHGEVQIRDDDNVVLVELGAGSFFGEGALMQDRPADLNVGDGQDDLDQEDKLVRAAKAKRRNANVIAKAFCYLFELGAGDFAEVMDSFPEMQDPLNRLLNQRRKQDARLKSRSKEGLTARDVPDTEEPEDADEMLTVAPAEPSPPPIFAESEDGEPSSPGEESGKNGAGSDGPAAGSSVTVPEQPGVSSSAVPAAPIAQASEDVAATGPGTSESRLPGTDSMATGSQGLTGSSLPASELPASGTVEPANPSGSDDSASGNLGADLAAARALYGSGGGVGAIRSTVEESVHGVAGADVHVVEVGAGNDSNVEKKVGAAVTGGARAGAGADGGDGAGAQAGAFTGDDDDFEGFGMSTSRTTGMGDVMDSIGSGLDLGGRTARTSAPASSRTFGVEAAEGAADSRALRSQLAKVAAMKATDQMGVHINGAGSGFPGHGEKSVIDKVSRRHAPREMVIAASIIQLSYRNFALRRKLAKSGKRLTATEELTHSFKLRVFSSRLRRALIAKTGWVGSLFGLKKMTEIQIQLLKTNVRFLVEDWDQSLESQRETLTRLEDNMSELNNLMTALLENIPMFASLRDRMHDLEDDQSEYDSDTTEPFAITQTSFGSELDTTMRSASSDDAPAAGAGGPSR